MNESIYSKRSNLIIGFHGTDKSVVEDIINKRDELKPSNNKYDWLGKGIYFWENNEERALNFPEERGKVSEPAVLGAIIDLGYCMDLTDLHFLNELKDAYDALLKVNKKAELPKNSKDMLRRDLDFAVIEMAHIIIDDKNEQPYDSVRGVFWEGDELYPTAGFRKKNHIQICIRNPNCIKGFFLPRNLSKEYTNPQLEEIVN